jgi:hypothetical protein
MRRDLFLIPCIAASIGLSTGLARAEVPVASASPQTGLDMLTAYAGRWDTEIHFLDTPYSHKSDTSYELRNDCWRSAGFYACDQFVEGASKALLVYTYDAEHGYSSYPISEDNMEVHAGHIDIQGKVWTFPWKGVKNGKTTYFHVINTWESPDSIQFRQEYSVDGEHWTLMAQGHETRIPAAGKQP